MQASYPELVRAKVPEGISAQLEELAGREQISISAYVRRLVVAHVRSVDNCSDQHTASVHAGGFPPQSRAA